MRHYYGLAKGALIVSDLAALAAGFLLGTQNHWGGVAGDPVDFFALASVMVGMALVMASGRVFNNCIDADIDARMEHAKSRAVASGRVSLYRALAFASALGVAGFLVMDLFAGAIAAAAAACGFIMYVLAYSAWSKRRTVYGTMISAAGGAMAPVVGYAAASGRIDMAAVIMFLIVITWRMPYYHAVAILDRDDHLAAGIPTMPVVHGIRRTKASILISIGEFAVAAILLVVYGYESYGYLALALFLATIWFLFGVSGTWVPDGPNSAAANRRWARQMSVCALIVIMTLFVAIGVLAVA